MSRRFEVPLSSSPPSTPDARRSLDKSHEFTTYAPHPSTTPAGPPPSATNSFTPAGHPPPSSVFGNSQPKSGDRLFSSQPSSINVLAPRSNGQIKFPGINKPRQQAWVGSASISSLGSTPLQPAQNVRTFAIPNSSSPIDLTTTSDHEEEDDDYEDEMDEEYEESNGDPSELMDENAKSNSFTAKPGLNGIPLKPSIANGSLASPSGIDWGRSNFGSSVGADTPRSTKRLRDNTTAYDVSVQQRPPAKRQKKESAIPGIIHNISTNLGTATLEETEHIILETESWFERINRDYDLPEDREKVVENALPKATQALCNLWRTRRAQLRVDVNIEDDIVMGIGPDEDADPLQKATFIAPLLLQLHHPPPVTGKQVFASSKSFRMSHPAAGLDSSQPPTRPTPLPKVFHDWLETHHNPYGSAITDLRIHYPNPTAHINYWDILFNMLLRGKVFDVVETLRKSNFQYARTARDENGSNGYKGVMLKNIGTAVSRMARVFEECPIQREDDWTLTGNGWKLFRKRIEQALADLTVFVEGDSEEQGRAVPEFEAPNFGVRNDSSTFGRSIREAERRVPSIIYENLKTMYGIVLGKTPEIVSSAQNWVEATLGLTIWWDGEDDDDENLGASFRVSRQSFQRSQMRADRTVDLNPTAAYVRRLAAAFERVTDDDDPDLFQINSNDSVEVGLASVFEGNVEGVIELLHSWSLPVSSAVAEIAYLGGWFESPTRPEKMGGFNQNDLMVLSYGQQEGGLTCDGILIDYAEALFKRASLKSLASEKKVEGWELSMQILSRLDDEELGINKIGELLQKLPLTSDKRVDKLLDLCHGFGLDREASDIAVRYADHFTNETDSYGNALIYYARAGRSKRVKNVLDLLISLSLVESKAFPPSVSLDDNLRALVERPKESLAVLANLDPDAAQLLQVQLTGYASLRRFYDLRDEEGRTNQGRNTSLRPMARRKAAISTLIAVINSAADNIHGGLYDPDRAAIVPVDGLLALLGEARVFINQSERKLSLSQCVDLLKAIEDLQIVTSRVYEQCEDCFRCTLTNGRRQRQQNRPDAKEMLKKSISNITTSSSSAFSLIESSMMDSETRESTGSEGVMIDMVTDADGAVARRDDVRRGWDWRKGVSADASGAELLRTMRLGLAREMARAWVEGEEL
ncbi:MAG: hypothetical protein Q9216_001437 [Gyalolechia sp. 2 TL-2023]